MGNTDLLMQQLHTKHMHEGPAGLECPECRADALRVVMRRLDVVDSRFDDLSAAVAENTRITAENTETLQDVKEVVEMGRTLFKLGAYIGAFAKWVAGIGAALTAGYAAWKGWK